MLALPNTSKSVFHVYLEPHPVARTLPSRADARYLASVRFLFTVSCTAPVARKSPHPLRDAVGDAGNRPGVYRMLGKHGEVMYVGKSKSLRTRLLSYFRAKRGEKGHRILGEAAGLEWEYQPSE